MSGACDALPRFDRRFFDSEHRLTRIGTGPLGGKAEGLRRLHDEIVARLDRSELSYVTVEVPRLVVVAADVFTRFMDRNRLWETALSGVANERIAHAFQRGELPAEIVGDLRGIISAVRTPLAVRSSSVLEDGVEHPFAGVYTTKMIPNHDLDEDARFRRLVEALKLVWASTFFSEARSSLASTDLAPGSERMAVVVQEIVGRRYGPRFYPTLSGVARSYNHYASGSARPEEGVVSLALGLGKTIVDGDLTWTYCPRWPAAPPPFNSVGDLLKFTQTRFWAVNMGETPAPDPIRETEWLVHDELSTAEADGTLRYLASTYDPRSDRLQPGLGPVGTRALTFAPLLTSRILPFSRVVERLLALAKESLAADVEIELAATLDPDGGLPMTIGCLQVRPMQGDGAHIAVGVEDLRGEGVLVASERCLGNGVRDDLADIVYLRPEAFDPAATRAIASELAEVNHELVAAGRHSVLIGFGRWGTSDERHGVPVVWGQISSARVIVEATLPEVQPELSQGSHFFHNVLGFRVFYLTVEHDDPHQIDWEWLDRQSSLRESRFLRHLRLERPLRVVVDGTSRRGVIRYDQRA